MIGDASLCPTPFEAIIVHSLSRFYRDSLEFALHKRKLKLAGMKVISIRQQTGDAPSGEMARKMISLFDEYQSKENAKRTWRAMKENARMIELTRELGEATIAGQRLLDAVEKGLIPPDTDLQMRSQKLQAHRQAILIEQASLKDKFEMPLRSLTAKHTEAFSRALRARLLNAESGFGKAYLSLLVDEIRLDGNELRIKGSYKALAKVYTQAKGTKPGEVRSCIPDWRPHGDSLLRSIFYVCLGRL